MLKICVIGGANVDITASSGEAFRLGDSNPGKVEVSWGGVGRNIAHNLALLGDEVQLLTIFGGGLFGPVIARACQDLGIGVSHSDIAPDGTNSFFVSINNADGELVGVVADANSSADALAWLIDHCRKPLFLDAVSVAKAGRIQEAVAMSKKKSFFALKCNAIENVALASVRGCRRRYVSVGAEGLKVEENGRLYEFPALPCLVRNVTGGGDALLAGIVHAGPEASVEESARWGLACARCAVESPHAVSDEIKKLIHE